VVVGVGHEIDFTIADFVADVRAPTPSAAAELISQDQVELKQTLESYQSWMEDQINNQIRHLKQTVAWQEKQLIHPGRRLEELSQRLDDLNVRMNAAVRAGIDQRRLDLSALIIDLKQHNPEKIIAMNIERCQQYSIRVKSAMQHQLEKITAKLGEAGRTLNTVSPLATLDRGYSILQTETENIVRSSNDVNVGDQLTAKLSSGYLKCTVDECLEKK